MYRIVIVSIAVLAVLWFDADAALMLAAVCLLLAFYDKIR